MKGHDDGNRRRVFLDRVCRKRPSSDDDVYLDAHEFGRQRRAPILFSVAITRFDEDIFAFDVTKLTQALPKCFDTVRNGGSGATREESDPWNFRRLLRIGRNKTGKQNCY